MTPELQQILTWWATAGAESWHLGTPEQREGSPGPKVWTGSGNEGRCVAECADPASALVIVQTRAAMRKLVEEVQRGPVAEKPAPKKRGRRPSMQQKKAIGEALVAAATDPSEDFVAAAERFVIAAQRQEAKAPIPFPPPPIYAALGTIPTNGTPQAPPCPDKDR